MSIQRGFWFTRLFVAAAAVGGIASAVFAPGIARATPTSYSLSINGCSSGCGTGPYGTVAVDSDASNASALDISVVLAPGYAFRHANDANHWAMAFSLAGNPIIAISGLSSAAFSRPDGTTFNDSPFGNFQYALACGGATCSTGFTAQNPTTLSFVVTPQTGSLTAASFVAGSAGTALFAVDVTTDGTCAECIAGSTGNVGAFAPISGGGTATAAPEPASLGLLGAALTFLGVVRRRRMR